jgi:arginyl-tRNA synthetase
MLKQALLRSVQLALDAARADGVLAADTPAFTLQQPERPEFGDWSVNIALVAAKATGKRPRDLAAALTPYLARIPTIRKVDIAGPGFINLFVVPEFAAQVFADFCAWFSAGACPQNDMTPERILVEYVSANPTGPLHVGHGRGAAVGDSVVRLLRRAGHKVDTEYYINDAGRQIETLALSTLARVYELRGEPSAIPEDGYRGEYLVEVARAFLAEHADEFESADPTTRARLCGSFAERFLLDRIRATLARFGVQFDTWRSERELYAAGAVAAAIDQLKARGAATTRDGALWLESDKFGDEKPRVIVRENGEPTYLAADIAYHAEKLGRGYDRLINFWGADHHGYEARIRAAIAALGFDPRRLEVRFIQLVSLMKDGEPVKMSKRAAAFETLDDVIDEVGVDAARFFYVLRRCESALDFDLDLAVAKRNDNPVYYVQYAHARVASLRRLAPERGISLPTSCAPEHLSDPADRDLIGHLLRYPGVLAEAARERAPHLIVYYLQDLAAAFHGYYNKQRILDPELGAVAAARLLLADRVGAVIADALGLIGVEAPEQM